MMLMMTRMKNGDDADALIILTMMLMTIMAVIVETTDEDIGSQC